MNSTEVQNPQRKLYDKCLCLPYVFGSVLACAKSAHVFQKLSYSLCGLCLSLKFLTNKSSSDSRPKAFLRFTAFSGSPTAVHRAFLFFDAKAWPVTNWPLHVHYGITLWAYLSQTHRPIAPHCMHYGITLSAYLSEPLVKDSRKRLSWRKTETTIPRAPSYHDHTLPLRTCYGEVYGNIASEENGWLSSRKFITLLTFELSSFRENGFLVLLHFPRCSRWYLSLDA